MAKILVIDDEPGMREVLDRVLRHKGHEVVLASGGQQGLERFRQDHPDVTILDLKMPDMNGLQTLKAIRTVDAHASVIILTGVGTERDEVEARALGVTEFIQKGFSLHVLGESLQRVLPEKAN